MNKFSLVMATIGRIKEVEEFIISLLNQTYKNYELIIVDQNEHYHLKEIYERYNKEISIKYIRSNKIGLSLNRNIGIQYVTGNIIAFPDDDCLYEFNTLEVIDDYFRKSNYDIYSCKVIDKVTRQSFGKSSKHDEIIKYFNVMKNCVSISVFILYKNISDIIFDENLGIGTYFGSGEESDLVFNLLHKGYSGKYFSKRFIYHPSRETKPFTVEKNTKDSLGLGALMKKEIIYRKNMRMIPFFLSRLIRPIVGIVVKSNNREIYINSIKYRLKGFREYNLK